MDLINKMYVFATCVLFVIIINDLLGYINYRNHKHEYGDQIKVYQNKNKKSSLLFNLIMAFAFILYIKNQINIEGFNYVLLPAYIVVVLLIFEISINMQKKWYVSEKGIINNGELLEWDNISVLKWSNNEISIIYKKKFMKFAINTKVTLVPVNSQKQSIMQIIEEKIKGLI